MNWKLRWNFGKRIKELERQIVWCIDHIVDLQREIDKLENRIVSLEKENLTNTTYDVGIQSRIHELEKRLTKLENPKKLPVKRKVKK